MEPTPERRRRETRPRLVIDMQKARLDSIKNAAFQRKMSPTEFSQAKIRAGIHMDNLAGNDWSVDLRNEHGEQVFSGPLSVLVSIFESDEALFAYFLTTKTDPK